MHDILALITPQSANADSSPARGAFTQMADRAHAFTYQRGTEGYARKMTTTYVGGCIFAQKVENMNPFLKIKG